MKNIYVVVKKELKRFLGDSRMVFSVLFPGILICILYTFMGNAFAQQTSLAEDYQYQIYVENLPEAFSYFKDNESFELTEISEAEIDGAKEKLSDQQIDLLVVFPEDFDLKISDYNIADQDTDVPEISMYYNSVSKESWAIYNKMCVMFDEYESMLANVFDFNEGSEQYDLATEQDSVAEVFSMLIPMFMITFIFSGCLSVASEAISGEKERCTIATLLMTPVKRSELAIGKILGLSIIGLFSGLSSFIGIMISLPKLTSGISGNVSLNAYGLKDYLLLLVVIMVTVLLIIGIIAVISGFAKNTREANMLATPLMIVVIVIAVLSIYGDKGKTALGLYAIPIYNSAKCMNAIFSFSITPGSMLVTVAANIVYTFIFAYILTRMFDNEKIIYDN